MSDLPAAPGGARRRRADAERSITAILDAAARVLGRNPHASVEEVARAAGTSRQTVYAHFPSREALVRALVDRTTERVVAAIDAAGLDALPAGEALVRLLDIGWQAFEAEPFLLNLPAGDQDAAAHAPVLARLERLVRRGQRDGDLDRHLPVAWILAATVALGHAAGEEVRAGRMSARQARGVLRDGVTRLFAPDATGASPGAHPGGLHADRDRQQDPP